MTKQTENGKIKVSECARKIAKEWTDANCSVTVLVDKDGYPVEVYGWYRDLIISKIDLK